MSLKIVSKGHDKLNIDLFFFLIKRKKCITRSVEQVWAGHFNKSRHFFFFKKSIVPGHWTFWQLSIKTYLSFGENCYHYWKEFNRSPKTYHKAFLKVNLGNIHYLKQICLNSFGNEDLWQAVHKTAIYIYHSWRMSFQEVCTVLSSRRCIDNRCNH